VPRNTPDDQGNAGLSAAKAREPPAPRRAVRCRVVGEPAAIGAFPPKISVAGVTSDLGVRLTT
jgi:hypothetical protein